MARTNRTVRQDSVGDLLLLELHEFPEHVDVLVKVTREALEVLALEPRIAAVFHPAVHGERDQDAEDQQRQLEDDLRPAHLAQGLRDAADRAQAVTLRRAASAWAARPFCSR